MPDEYEKRVWGLDFGYVNPAALVEIRVIGQETWEEQHIYDKGLTNPQLATKIEAVVPNHERIIADSAEPKSIQELTNAGLNVFPCHKGPDSVTQGINAVRQFKTHLHRDSTDLIKEKSGYKWAVDKDDKIKQPPKPVDLDNHLMDAERYAISSIINRVKVEVIAVDPNDPDDYDDEEAMWDIQG